MKTILTLLLLALGWHCLAAQTLVGNPYEGCCGFQANLVSIGDAKVSVPNVFTPNGDGLNDLFLPFASSDILKVTDFIITNLDADTVFFQARDFRLSEGSVGWDGRTAEGIYHRGAFRYQMVVYNKAGENRLLSGKACSVLCEKNSAILKDNADCLFPIQARTLDAAAASGPSFEHKRCFKN